MFFLFRSIHQPMTRIKLDIIDFIVAPFIPFLGGDFPNWFPKWSSGDFLVFLLSVYGLFVVMFYNSNFLAELVKQEWTTPIDKLEDIVPSGRPYMSNPGVYWDFIEEEYEELAEYAKMTSGKILS